MSDLLKQNIEYFFFFFNFAFMSGLEMTFEVGRHVHQWQVHNSGMFVK